MDLLQHFVGYVIKLVMTDVKSKMKGMGALCLLIKNVIQEFVGILFLIMINQM